MAEPGRADLGADFTTNQVCQDSFHFFKSLEGQGGAAEPDVPQSPGKTRERHKLALERWQMPRMIPSSAPHISRDNSTAHSASQTRGKAERK